MHGCVPVISFLRVLWTIYDIGMGYLLGPTVGAASWRLTHRRTMKLIDARDREFHKRIVKNRVDPTAQSPTNPVPDFYGLCYC
jgi:mitochondrial import inner membrane translocase subunit TIM23